MAIKVAINGYGRIGRNILRALYESNRTGEISIVAINVCLGSPKAKAVRSSTRPASAIWTVRAAPLSSPWDIRIPR